MSASWQDKEVHRISKMNRIHSLRNVNETKKKARTTTKKQQQQGCIKITKICFVVWHTMDFVNHLTPFYDHESDLR